MTESKLGYWQGKAAEKYYKEHPEASINDVAKALKINQRTAARARKKLVEAGVLLAGRRASQDLPIPPKGVGTVDTPAPELPSTLPETKKGKKEGARVNETLLDAQALKQINDTIESFANENDDDLTRHRMLVEIKRIFFDTRLHPDTRMSASQIWIKLKDMMRAKELGPGKPMTAELAVDRMVDVMLALGSTLTIKALYKAFHLEESNGQMPDQQGATASRTAEATGAIGHEDNPPKDGGLRKSNMEGNNK